MLALLRVELHLDRQGLTLCRDREGLPAVGCLWSQLASWVTMVPVIHIHCFAESYCHYSYCDPLLLLSFTTYKSKTQS